MSVLLIASLAMLAMATLGSVSIMRRTGEMRVALLTGLFVLLSIFLQSLDLDELRRFYVETGGDQGMILLAIVALLAGVEQLPGRRERRFWGQIAAGFVAWAAVFVIFLATPPDRWTCRLAWQ